MKSFFIKNLLKTITITFIIIIGLILVINKIETDIEKKLINITISKGIETAKKAQKIIDSNLSFDKKNNLLNILIGDDIKYLYALKYEKNKFRFIADGSDIKDRALFRQPFHPLNKSLWQKALNSKKIAYKINSKVDGVWLTLLYPTNKYIIAMDISMKEYKTIENILKSTKKYILILLLFSIFILILAAYLSYKLTIQKIELFTDPLTKTYNRNFLYFIEKKLKNNYVVAIFDIDDFKHINDTYGHDVGDIVLKTLVKIIKSQIREEDYLIRFGGEEFVLILTNISKEDAIKKINNIYKKINTTPIRAKNFEIYITISGGVHLEPYKERSLLEAIKKADAELYRAKRDGKNRFYIYNENNSKLFLYSEIIEAIEKKDILIYLQPILNAKTSKIEKFEALARLKFNNKIYPPASFLDQIVNTNYYRDFTKIVLTKVLDIIKNKKIYINVNFYIHDFFDEKFLNMLEEFKKEKKYLKYLTIELLENQKVYDLNELNNKLKELKKDEIKIAIDDFGSEFNNLNYLVSLEVDYLKIDASIIRGIKAKKNQIIVKNIVSLAKDLNIKTVAEFVEDKESFEILKNLNIDYIQGYFISKPFPLIKLNDYIS